MKQTIIMIVVHSTCGFIFFFIFENKNIGVFTSTYLCISVCRKSTKKSRRSPRQLVVEWDISREERMYSFSSKPRREKPETVYFPFWFVFFLGMIGSDWRLWATLKSPKSLMCLFTPDRRFPKRHKTERKK